MSFASDISVHDSNLTAFGKKLLLMMMSDTPIFSRTECSLIHTWIAQSIRLSLLILIVMTTTPGNDLLS